MRYALISDIHANVQALDAVLADTDTRGDVDAVYHLGDLVGYASTPNEVVERLRTRAIAGIAGNYDSTVATDYKHCGCKSESVRQEELAHSSYEFTRRAVSATTKRFLAGLPFSLDLRPLGGHAAGPRLVLVHGTPTLNTVCFTEDRPDDFCRKMAASVGLKAGDMLAFGHTHKPWHRVVDGIGCRSARRRRRWSSCACRTTSNRRRPASVRLACRKTLWRSCKPVRRRRPQRLVQ